MTGTKLAKRELAFVAEAMAKMKAGTRTDLMPAGTRLSSIPAVASGDTETSERRAPGLCPTTPPRSRSTVDTSYASGPLPHTFLGKKRFSKWEEPHGKLPETLSQPSKSSTFGAGFHHPGSSLGRGARTPAVAALHRVHRGRLARFFLNRRGAILSVGRVSSFGDPRANDGSLPGFTSTPERMNP